MTSIKSYYDELSMRPAGLKIFKYSPLKGEEILIKNSETFLSVVEDLLKTHSEFSNRIDCGEPPKYDEGIDESGNTELSPAEQEQADADREKLALDYAVVAPQFSNFRDKIDPEHAVTLNELWPFYRAMRNSLISYVNMTNEAIRALVRAHPLNLCLSPMDWLEVHPPVFDNLSKMQPVPIIFRSRAYDGLDISLREIRCRSNVEGLDYSRLDSISRYILHSIQADALKRTKDTRIGHYLTNSSSKSDIINTNLHSANTFFVSDGDQQVKIKPWNDTEIMTVCRFNNLEAIKFDNKFKTANRDGYIPFTHNPSLHLSLKGFRDDNFIHYTSPRGFTSFQFFGVQWVMLQIQEWSLTKGLKSRDDRRIVVLAMSSYIEMLRKMASVSSEAPLPWCYSDLLNHVDDKEIFTIKLSPLDVDTSLEYASEGPNPNYILRNPYILHKWQYLSDEERAEIMKLQTLLCDESLDEIEKFPASTPTIIEYKKDCFYHALASIQSRSRVLSETVIRNPLNFYNYTV